MVYDIHLDIFEGPLDLLVHLVKKNDLGINEIKIAEITAEYLVHLDSMQETQYRYSRRVSCYGVDSYAGKGENTCSVK